MLLLLPFYTPKDKKRNDEIRNVLNLHISNKCIKKIILLVDDDTFSVEKPNSEKISICRFDRRPTFCDWIKESKKYVDEFELITCANGDIEFSDNFESLALKELKDKKSVLCISRYEQTNENQITLHKNPKWSQDTWCIRSEDLNYFNEQDLEQLIIPFAFMRCENKFAYELWLQGWKIINPCKRIRTIHHQENNARNYNPKDRKIIGIVAFPYESNMVGQESEIELSIFLLSETLKKVEELKITNWLLNKKNEAQILIPKQKGFKQGSEEKIFNLEKATKRGIEYPKLINDNSHISKRKFISVVTINSNNGKGLGKTIDSVKSQIDKSFFEYIVVDRNSDDNSIEVLNKNKSIIDQLIIEKDEGIYDAMNKGVSLAKSEYIIFLNSGDAFHKTSSLQNIYKSHKEIINSKEERPIAYYSDTILNDGSIWKVKDPREIWQGMICSHQSIAIDTYFLKKNMFNLGYWIVSDYELILKAFLTGKPFHKIKHPISEIETAVPTSNTKERSIERWLVNLRLFKNDNNKLSSINNYYSELLNNHIKSDIEKRIIFLISMPRSGSTLLQRLIESNNKISSSGEPWIMLPIISIYDKEIIKASYNQDINILALKDFTKEINFSTNLMVRSAQLNYIRSIYSTILETLESEYYLDKTPRYVHIIDKLVEILPNAKYIVLLREPEAIINSYATTWKNNDFKKVLSNEYFKYDFTHGFAKLFEFVESSFLNKKIVKYEDLVRNQEKVMRDIGDFLNLDFNQSFIFNSEKAINRLMGDPKSINNQKKVFSESVSSWEKNIDDSNLHDFLKLLDLVPENAFNYYGKTKFAAKLFVKQIEKNTSTKNVSPKKYLPKGPTLGIILTCYNNSKDIIKSLNSVLNQTRFPDKIVIIDDKSTDSSVALIKEFINKNSIKKKCKLIVNKFNYGVGKSRDLAIKNCNTDYITTLDCDDTIHPDKLKYEFEAIIRNNACIAFSDIELEFVNKKIVQNTAAYDKKSQRKLVELLLSRSAPVPRDMLFRKTCYKNVGGFIHGFNLYEDWHLKIRLSKFCGSKGWVHSGKVGTIYNRKNPGLSNKTQIQLLWQQSKVISLNNNIISRNIKNYSYIAINFLKLAKNLPLPNFKNYLELLINDMQTPLIFKNFLDPIHNSLLDFSIKNEQKRLSDDELVVYLEKYFSPIAIDLFNQNNLIV